MRPGDVVLGLLCMLSKVSASQPQSEKGKLHLEPPSAQLSLPEPPGRQILHSRSDSLSMSSGQLREIKHNIVEIIIITKCQSFTCSESFKWIASLHLHAHHTSRGLPLL